MTAKLVLFMKQPPQEIEVLYVMWHTGSGQMPGRCNDSVWAWIPDLRMRRGSATRSCQAAHKKWGNECYYRPPRDRVATPVRIFGGKKWRWYWLYK